MAVKKVFIIILSCLFIVLGFSYLKIYLIKIDNKSISSKITELKKDNESIENDILKTEKQIDKLKDENKEKWQELSMWRKTKEKIENVLSQ